MTGNAITSDSIVRQSQGQVSTEIDGETVLLSIDRGNYYGMNRVLSTIWSWLERPMTVSAVCRRMTETYEVTDEVCQRDVMKALADLQKEGLIDVQ